MAQEQELRPRNTLASRLKAGGPPEIPSRTPVAQELDAGSHTQPLLQSAAETAKRTGKRPKGEQRNVGSIMSLICRAGRDRETGTDTETNK